MEWLLLLTLGAGDWLQALIQEKGFECAEVRARIQRPLEQDIEVYCRDAEGTFKVYSIQETAAGWAVSERLPVRPS